MISLGLHWRWWQLAALFPLVPLAALGLSLIVPESPVFRSVTVTNMTVSKDVNKEH